MYVELQAFLEFEQIHERGKRGTAVTAYFT